MKCRIGTISITATGQKRGLLPLHVASIITGNTVIHLMESNLQPDKLSPAPMTAGADQMEKVARAIAAIYGIKITSVDVLGLDDDVHQAMSSDEPWQRNEAMTADILLLVSDLPAVETQGYDDMVQQIAGWTDQQCQDAENWAAAEYLIASDNDVESMAKPPHVWALELNFKDANASGNTQNQS